MEDQNNNFFTTISQVAQEPQNILLENSKVGLSDTVSKLETEKEELTNKEVELQTELATKNIAEVPEKTIPKNKLKIKPVNLFLGALAIGAIVFIIAKQIKTKPIVIQ